MHNEVQHISLSLAVVNAQQHHLSRSHLFVRNGRGHSLLSVRPDIVHHTRVHPGAERGQLRERYRHGRVGISAVEQSHCSSLVWRVRVRVGVGVRVTAAALSGA